jgi:hypothetical protein
MEEKMFAMPLLRPCKVPYLVVAVGGVATAAQAAAASSTKTIRFMACRSSTVTLLDVELVAFLFCHFL